MSASDWLRSIGNVASELISGDRLFSDNSSSNSKSNDDDEDDYYPDWESGRGWYDEHKND